MDKAYTCNFTLSHLLSAFMVNVDGLNLHYSVCA